VEVWRYWGDHYDGRRESRYYCLFSIHWCFIVLVGVVLSVVRVNRIWGAASDWLAGRVVCEV
jgi:hypothetical protein